MSNFEEKKCQEIKIELISLNDLGSAYHQAIRKFKDSLKEFVNFGDYDIWNAEIKLLKIEFQDNCKNGAEYTAVFEITLKS